MADHETSQPKPLHLDRGTRPKLKLLSDNYLRRCHTMCSCEKVIIVISLRKKRFLLSIRKNKSFYSHIIAKQLGWN